MRRADGVMKVLVLCIVLSVWIIDKPVYAEQQAEGRAAQYCLGCHRQEGAEKRFADGSSVQAYINADAFAKSVHGKLACTGCHQEFANGHPERSFRNKMQYRIIASRRCRECHPDGAINSRTVHVALLKKENKGEAIICTNCHSAHAVARVVAGNVTTSEEKHCMSCHALEGRMGFVNGESVPTRVDMAELRGSLHSRTGCSDCHFGFSAAEHPVRKFRSEREYRHSSAEICRRCHYDKYSKVSEGVHFAMLSVGRLDAPTCVDCHGTHVISSPSMSRLSIVKKCAPCHSAVYAAYAKSVHGSALFNENSRDAAICTDCHSSHRIKDPASSEFHDYIPDKCSACHSNAAIMGRYGLSTEVVRTYLSDFHGMTLSLYRSEPGRRFGPPPAMAVCTDCHGIHDIARVSGSDMTAMKGKLLKRCGACHPGATENFPDAWLSHYTPGFKIAPMVFITEQFYKIMLPLSVVGILFLVLLDLRRYLKNR